MKVIVMLAVVISANAYSSTMSCRDAVVKAQGLLGNVISASDFSSRNFADYNISTAEFNELNSSEQVEIYNQIKPLPVMVEETIYGLNNRISAYTNSVYAYFYLDDIESMRDARLELRTCR
jgi:hypothetical protein